MVFTLDLCFQLLVVLVGCARFVIVQIAWG